MKQEHKDLIKTLFSVNSLETNEFKYSYFTMESHNGTEYTKSIYKDTFVISIEVSSTKIIHMIIFSEILEPKDKIDIFNKLEEKLRNYHNDVDYEILRIENIDVERDEFRRKRTLDFQEKQAMKLLSTYKDPPPENFYRIKENTLGKVTIENIISEFQ